MKKKTTKACQRGQNLVTVGSVKPVIATLDLDVIFVPKVKKKAISKVIREPRISFAATRELKS
jgi:hypothetical protein